ncbi:hypothetical protein Ddye_011216 [Dipteronia dyeriana]|uniref:Uncharacterized protein n=1 Tax=Dipteronia dyeriana TaxID=168575 RepID=A0AAD9X265_9ROSI|nr:hypothetical protein Ddye_011216 [Dipteronia dyeriana]
MKEGTEKKVSATTGFIAGQLMMFISIYYVPLHLALGRPHTITVLALPGSGHLSFKEAAGIRLPLGVGYYERKLIMDYQ